MKPGILNELWAERLKKGSVTKFKVASGSMKPLINIGDRVAVKKVDNLGRVRLGDIVLFSTTGNYVVHRIIGKSHQRGELFFRQKGDASLQSGIVSGREIRGKIIAIEKSHGLIRLDTRAANVASFLLGVYFALSDGAYRALKKIKTTFFTKHADSDTRLFKVIKIMLGKTPEFFVNIFLRSKRNKIDPG